MANTKTNNYKKSKKLNLKNRKYTKKNLRKQKGGVWEGLYGENLDYPFPKNAFSIGADNMNKNRYANILPVNNTRVILDPPVKGSDYINANTIFPALIIGKNNTILSNPFNMFKLLIAAQGPIHSNERKVKGKGEYKNTIEEFNAMLEQQKITDVVMLCNLQEGISHKCGKYHNNIKNYEDAVKEDKNGKGYLTQTFTTKETKGHKYKHHHYYSWPDHGIPTSNDNLRKLIEEIMNDKPEEKRVVVHCSAGVGRTGTFIMMCHIYNQIMINNASYTTLDKDITTLRSLRNNAMVQSEAQYDLLNRYIIELNEKIKENNPRLPSRSSSSKESHMEHISHENETEDKVSEFQQYILKQIPQLGDLMSKNVEDPILLQLIPKDKSKTYEQLIEEILNRLNIKYNGDYTVNHHADLISLSRMLESPTIGNTTDKPGIVSQLTQYVETYLCKYNLNADGKNLCASDIYNNNNNNRNSSRSSSRSSRKSSTRSGSSRSLTRKGSRGSAKRSLEKSNPITPPGTPSSRKFTRKAIGRRNTKTQIDPMFKILPDTKLKIPASFLTTTSVNRDAFLNATKSIDKLTFDKIKRDEWLTHFYKETYKVNELPKKKPKNMKELKDNLEEIRTFFIGTLTTHNQSSA